MIEPLLALWEALALLPRARRPVLLELHDVPDADWLRGLAAALRRRWTPIPLAEFVARHASGRLTTEHLAVTLDDGLRTIRTVVRPVLAEWDIPFTTFVCGDVLAGGPAPWFHRVEALLREHPASRLAGFWGLPAGSVSTGFVLLNALKPAPFPRLLEGLDRAERALAVDSSGLREDFLAPEDVVALGRDPLVTVGAHSHRHPILSVLSEPEQEEEIVRSRDVLTPLLGSPPRFFAYPNGKPADFGAGTVAALRRHGFEAAVTTVQRPVAPGDDALRLPRLGITAGDGTWKIRLKRDLPLPSRGDGLEARTRRRFASAWRAGD